MPRPTYALGACILLFLHSTIAKIFNNCELAQELRNQGFAEDQLTKWICIVENESSMQTDVKGGPDPDGSYDYGLFQINDRYWCSAGNTPGKGCNLRCSDLLSDDITHAARCAMQIYRQQGLTAWTAWNEKCKKNKLQKLNC